MTERTCIVTRTTHEPDDLIRFVAGPDGQVVPDLKRRLPGRGVWVHARRKLVEKAMAKSLFARGLKRGVTTKTELPDLIDELLVKQALGAIGFARKAGECIMGADKVEAAVRGGKAIAVVHALDGAQDGLRKLSQAVFALERDKGRKIKIQRVFTSAQMDLALGATNVIHACLTEGGAAQNGLLRITQLADYREPTVL